MVIVAWNCREDIATCVSHVERHTRYPNWKLVVIDNLSSDGTREWLSAYKSERLQLILADENLGWVRALNLALQRFDTDYYFFLNPDAFVEPDWLQPLVTALEQSPSAGFASPKFKYPDGRIHYAGAYIARTGGIRVHGHGDADGDSYSQSREVPFAHGQCLLRAKTAREVGMFDEGFGLGYYEEVDYQLRARRLGWKALYVPQSVIVHATARSFAKHPGKFKEELMIRNWLRVLALHWPGSSLAWRLPLELLRPLRMLRDGADVAPMFRAWRGWLKTLPQIASRRAGIMRDGSPVNFSELQRPA